MAASDSLEEKLPAEKKYMYFFGAVAKSGVEGELERKRLDKKEELGQRRKENRERFLSRGWAEKLSGWGANPTPGSTPGTFIVNHIFLFWVSFYWMSLLLYVFVYTLVLLVFSLFHGSDLRN